MGMDYKSGWLDLFELIYCFQHRDTNASIIGHPDHLSMISVCENLTRGRAKYELLKRMIQPCGPPPEKTPLDDL
jgi:hypothetical protein